MDCSRSKKQGINWFWDWSERYYAFWKFIKKPHMLILKNMLKTRYASYNLIAAKKLIGKATTLLSNVWIDCCSIIVTFCIKNLLPIKESLYDWISCSYFHEASSFVFYSFLALPKKLNLFATKILKRCQKSLYLSHNHLSYFL